MSHQTSIPNNSQGKGKFYPLQLEEWLYACRELTTATHAVLYYIRTTDPDNQGIEINCAKVPHLLSKPERTVHRQTVSRALKELVIKGYLPERYRFTSIPVDDTERKIRDRLQVELGGSLVITAVGRIDLLTESELIEIKEINNWKEALGKILAILAFFPSHNKRIHLFGRANLKKLALAQALSAEFGITVTFEEVQP